MNEYLMSDMYLNTIRKLFQTYVSKVMIYFSNSKQCNNNNVYLAVYAYN